MKITGAKQISKSITQKFGNYNFEVGILSDANKKKRGKGTKKFAGMEIAASGNSSTTDKDYAATKTGKLSLVYIAKTLEKYHFKWLTRPFKYKGLNHDVQRMVDELAAQVFGKKSPNNKRLENAVQAVVRNPILRGDYGSNATSTIASKGFDKLGIATGQFFKAIKAKRL
jgi:hypothetical protein